MAAATAGLMAHPAIQRQQGAVLMVAAQVEAVPAEVRGVAVLAVEVRVAAILAAAPQARW
ncbi:MULTISPECIES: hypothetical protein [unclassified Pseudomonas]|uniref:hypothetical protein n=1 Tax=unclassified Pseudomonas TaxID=196821 RepID=UPI0035C24F76